MSPVLRTFYLCYGERATDAEMEVGYVNCGGPSARWKRQEKKAGLYMDSINAMVMDRLCLEWAVKHTQRCGEASGTKLNVNKSTVMVVSEMGDMLELGVQVTDKEIKV